MRYHHKRAPCCKDTREILENVLKAEEVVYDLIERSESVSVKSPAEEALGSGTDVNVMDETADRVLSNGPAKSEELAPSPATANGAGTEVYKNSLEVGLRVPDAEDPYKKRRARGNRLDGYRDYYEL